MWLGQFAYGFPIAGQLSQKHLFPADSPRYARLAMDRIFHLAASRFRERAAKYGHKNAHPLWDEATQQVGQGWLLPPTPLFDGGQPLSWHSEEFNISFRFGDLQTYKLRACDDLKHWMTNLACAAETPTQLDSWDNIAQLSNHLASMGGDWVMFKADHKAAYRQLPIDPADQATSIVALRLPMEGKWYGFVVRTLIFGTAAAVLHYNVLARILRALVNRYIGIPLVGYFGDFAAITPSVIGRPSMNAFSRFARALVFELRDKKFDLYGDVVFLGLLGSFPSARNGGQLRIARPEEHRPKWPTLISNYLKEGGFPTAVWES